MENSQKKSVSTIAAMLLCSLLSVWLFSLPVPEFNSSARQLSDLESFALLGNAGVKQLKSSDVGITSTAARFNGVPELREVVQQERAINFFLHYKNFTFFHTRVFYNSLSFINHRNSIFPPQFFILFRKLRL